MNVFYSNEKAGAGRARLRQTDVKRRGRKAWSIALFFILAAAGTLRAQEPLDELAADKTVISYSKVESEGYVEFEVPWYYDSSGRGWDARFRGLNNVVAILDGTTEIEILRYQEYPYDTWGGVGDYLPNVDFCLEGTHYERRNGVGGGGTRTIIVRWYFSEQFVGVPIVFRVNSSIDKQNDLSEPTTRTHDFPSYTIKGVNRLLDGSMTFAELGRQTVAFQSETDLPANVRFRFDDAEQWTDRADGKDKVFASEYATGPDERSVKLELTKRYSDYATQRATKTFTLKGYQAVEDFTVTYDPAGKALLSWRLEQGAGERETGDRFVIQRADNPDFANAVEVTRMMVDIDQTEPFTYADDLVPDFIQGDIYYRITRSKTLETAGWGWAFGAQASLHDVVLEHRRITSAAVELGRNAEGRHVAILTWETNGADKVWSAGSRFVITRENLTTVSTQEVAGITQEILAAGTYTDVGIQACNEYRYVLSVRPGSSDFPTVEAATEAILPVEVGELTGMEASKGYFSDRVELSWETDGTFDQFSVRRRIYGSGAAFTQVATVDGTAVNTLYNTEDRTCVPGEVYEYQIVGLVECGDGVLEAEAPLADIGFRTPTGDIYGRVTYESGQAVAGVEVRAELSEPNSSLAGKSYALQAGDRLEIADAALLADATDSLTVQAWVWAEAAGTVIGKGGLFALSVTADRRIAFKAGADEVVSDHTPDDHSARYVHVTAVLTADRLLLYLDGEAAGEAQRTGGVLTPDRQTRVTMGGDTFAGHIDEVRLWNTALAPEVIARDHARYLTGGEAGLAAYYTFDYSVDDRFFDTSYSGTDYHALHGTVHGARLTTEVPTPDQLGYKGVTATDGSYSIRAIPYSGNGTSYMIIPRLGIHAFESEKELRFINAEAQSHTVNFTDKSSFLVSGKVTYAGGTIPVEGVSFRIDGVTAMDGKANVITTDAAGMFSINVPVGVHEVRAEKLHHSFANSGKITNSDGTDRNYQDMVTGIELTDITTVRYIGRVAGGAVQEAYPVGHSLSTNNLGDGICVTLTYPNEAYELAVKDSTATLTHFDGKHKNRVTYSGNTVTIYPDLETGEFVADVLPERFRVDVAAPGHDNTPLPGSGSELNLTNRFSIEASVNDYTVTDEDGMTTAVSDTVRYNMLQQFIKRYTPVMDVRQLDAGLQPLPYYGDTTYRVNTLLLENSYDISLYDKGNNTYLLGLPVYGQGRQVTFGVSAFEEYVYKDEAGLDKDGVLPDRVPTQDARITFGGDLAYVDGVAEELVVDSTGYVEYAFQVGNPELTSGIRSISAKMTYGDSDNPTSIDWSGKFDAVVLGAELQGTNFITAGPDEIMFVLRDPPGSNSYAYLEKGVTVSKNSTYIGSVANEGSEMLNTKSGVTMVTFAGLGAGTIISNEVNNEMGMGITHSETVGGVNEKDRVTTTTTRFQTSADPQYVGADGDLYVGYSTNMTLGSTINIGIVPKEMYDANTDAYELIEDITPATADWLLVKTTGLGVNQSFGTLFAYPQIHIEQVLLPQMEDYRNSLLRQEAEGSPADFQAMANRDGKAVYVSKLPSNDPNYGKSNSDKVFPHPDDEDIFDGASYKIYFPEGTVAKNDTILALNQSIDNWVKHLKENEADKVKATLLQNYSYQAGASVEYAESYSYAFTAQTNFTLTVGAEVSGSTGVVVSGAGFILEVHENAYTEQGGEFSTTEEANRCKGFVLEDEGTDYLTVDVCRPAGYLADDEYIEYKDMVGGEPQFSTFIFKTRGGATSCPYEPGYTTKYYEPGQHVIDEPTVQVEVPEISVEDDFIDLVPSGQPAYVTLYIRNNSESKDDNWFNLKIVDDSNPNGAGLVMDASPIGNGRALLVPAGETLVKTLEVRKGSVMNYDNLQLTLESQCQCDPTDLLADIADTVTFTVHFTPSATPVNISEPADNWTYNTKLPSDEATGKHYMTVQLDGFDVNYDNFHRIMLQYKPTSGGEWTTLIHFYNDAELAAEAEENGQTVALIADVLNAATGRISYNWYLDDLQDQRYDLRAVGVSMINNTEVENASKVHSGIKDMYNPRLFGSAQPANGVLTVTDEVRLNFNETIADGYLTDNNFSVTGVRNGARTDHSVSVRLDGANDVLSSEFVRNWAGKDLTVELWILPDAPQDAVLFSQGNVNEALELGLTADNRLKVRVGTTEVTSDKTVPHEQGTWAHVALVFDSEGYVSAYYNFEEYISRAETGAYGGEGTYAFGASVNGGGHFAGLLHNARIWDKVVTSGRLQTNSLTLFSGAESNLLAYYPMNETKGMVLLDKARGANLAMEGGKWALPEGRAAAFNGTSQYLRLSTGSSAVIDSSMDYTMEFWFRAEPGQTDATLAANGRGDGQDMGGSRDLFSIGFEGGVLTYYNNEVKVTVEGNYLDNDWHHLALAVSRTTGRGQILVDGELKSYFESQDLGGVASAYLYLGARIWQGTDNAQTVHTDNFFRGEIDDFRLWKLYRNETMVADGNSERLDGTEKGLLAYYPFEHYVEWQGTPELQFTLADKKEQDDPTQAVPDAEAFGGNVETATTAPVRDKGPVSDLLYDFVVNNDALIITLREPVDRIEKTTVTFTVDGVRDVNGNEMLSPVTWSAYIDRNQLKWSESAVTVVKPAYEEGSFTMRAVNNGGSVQRFTMENMPEWLLVSPASGTIDPTGYIDVAFTIDEGLNVGTYNEIVYMRNDNNVVEALEVNVTVRGEEPDWTVNPADYKYNMSVLGKLRINNMFSADKEDKLAAFIDGRCVGVANNSYDRTHDMWYAFLTVYSNSKTVDGVEFRMWDAGTGRVYGATPDEPIPFVNDAIYGDDEPVVFDGRELFFQNIALTTGWNWVSFNLASNALADVNALLANGRWTADDVVKGENHFDSYSVNGDKWTGTLSANGGFDNVSLYMIKSSADQTLSVSGTAVDVRTMPVTVRGNRWNYIGYLPAENYTVGEALAGYDVRKGDIVKSQSRFAVYSGNGWIGNLTYMEANKGYMLFRTATDDVTFTYPSTRGSLGNLRTKRAAHETEAFVNAAYADNMGVIARAEGVEPGDRIVARVNGEVRGVAESVLTDDAAELLFITVAGADGDRMVTFELERDGEVIARAASSVAYHTNAVQGTVEEPFVLDFTAAAVTTRAYPNPFADRLDLSVDIAADDSRVVITVYNLLGHAVTRHDDTAAAGQYRWQWDGRTAAGNLCPAGTYLLRVEVNGNVTALKVERK